jgi:hypothetical protein
MRAVGVVGGVAVLLGVLWDAFETIVLPRCVGRRVRLTRSFYRLTWLAWRALGRRLRPGNFRGNLLSVYGPLSLLFLLATWAVLLIVAFALIQWGAGDQLNVPAGVHGFAADLYYSGTTMFTIGLGDLAPRSTTARILTVLEGGTGLGFLALILGYLPVMAQAFSRREANISLLDARAGSPPSAAELLKRHSGPDAYDALERLLSEWERWSADLLETQISFPALVYYRSQHDNQSWISALTTILDTCALIRLRRSLQPVPAPACIAGAGPPASVGSGPVTRGARRRRPAIAGRARDRAEAAAAASDVRAIPRRARRVPTDAAAVMAARRARRRQLGTDAIATSGRRRIFGHRRQ